MNRNRFILLAGCSKSRESRAGGSNAKSRGLIGVSLLTLDNPFFKVIGDNITSGGAMIDIVTELESGGAKDTGYKAAEDARQAHQDLRGIFAINDPAALRVRAALEKAGKADQIVIVGFDGQPEGRQAIRDGRIYADPIQFPVKMGLRIVDAIVRHSKGETLPPQMLIPASLYRKADAEKDPELK